MSSQQQILKQQQQEVINGILSLPTNNASLEDVCSQLDPIFGSFFDRGKSNASSEEYEFNSDKNESNGVAMPAPIVIACDKNQESVLLYAQQQLKQYCTEKITNEKNIQYSGSKYHQVKLIWGHPLESVSTNGNASIHHAACSGCVISLDVLVDLLEDCKDDVSGNNKQQRGKVEDCDCRALERLLLCKNEHGDTPLMMACVAGQSKFIHEAITRANRCRCDGSTLVQRLLQTDQNYSGDTVLSLSIGYGKELITQNILTQIKVSNEDLVKCRPILERLNVLAFKATRAEALPQQKNNNNESNGDDDSIMIERIKKCYGLLRYAAEKSAEDSMMELLSLENSNEKNRNTRLFVQQQQKSKSKTIPNEGSNKKRAKKKKKKRKKLKAAATVNMEESLVGNVSPSTTDDGTRRTEKTNSADDNEDIACYNSSSSSDETGLPSSIDQSPSVLSSSSQFDEEVGSKNIHPLPTLPGMGEDDTSSWTKVVSKKQSSKKEASKANITKKESPPLPPMPSPSLQNKNENSRIKRLRSSQLDEHDGNKLEGHDGTKDRSASIVITSPSSSLLSSASSSSTITDLNKLMTLPAPAIASTAPAVSAKTTAASSAISLPSNYYYFDALESLCLGVEDLLKPAPTMAVDLSSAQLDGVDLVLRQQLQAVEQARQLQKMFRHCDR